MIAYSEEEHWELGKENLAMMIIIIMSYWQCAVVWIVKK